MQKLYFSNNGEALLAAALPNDPGDPAFGTVVVDLAAADTFSQDLYGGQTPDTTYSGELGMGQLVTLTNDASAPGSYEVVFLTSRSNDAQAEFHVVRGVELSPDLSAPAAWPTGTKMQARVTAKTLSAFAQIPPSNIVQAESGFLTAGVGAFKTAPVLKGVPPYPVSAGSLGVSMPIVAAGLFVDLGEPPTFSKPGNYYHGSAVLPPDPDGNQYVVYTRGGYTASLSSEDPLVDFTGGATTVVSNVLGEEMFRLVRVDPTDMESGQYQGALLVVEEVGFITTEVTATTTPSVSIGYRDAGASAYATHFANGVPLSEITSGRQIHRIPIATSNVLASSLLFRLDTAATGGVFRGRFYWRGFLIPGDDSL